MRSRTIPRQLCAVTAITLCMFVVADGNVAKVIQLNRYTFNGNVLDVGNNHVDHWMVRFCYDWYEPCNRLKHFYYKLARNADNIINTNDSFTTSVRFADVDCGVERVLCNYHEVDDMPLIVHYHRQQRVSDWVGRGRNSTDNARSMAKWATEQLLTGEKHDVETGSNIVAVVVDAAIDLLSPVFSIIFETLEPMFLIVEPMLLLWVDQLGVAAISIFVALVFVGNFFFSKSDDGKTKHDDEKKCRPVFTSESTAFTSLEPRPCEPVHAAAPVETESASARQIMPESWLTWRPVVEMEL